MRFRIEMRRWPERSSYAARSVLTDEERIMVVPCIPRGDRSDVAVPSPARCAVRLAGGDPTLPVVVVDRGSSASSWWEELARATLRRSARACLERWPERLRRRDEGGGGAEISTFASLERRRMW